ncbi:putative PUA-like superfamily, SRA-YDG superfamily protein [Septoria linicola]|nr:putative PUA-like superfamily, SRA-YDG superfamily protein [Septoria linicola]
MSPPVVERMTPEEQEALWAAQDENDVARKRLDEHYAKLKPSVESTKRAAACTRGGRDASRYEDDVQKLLDFHEDVEMFPTPKHALKLGSMLQLIFAVAEIPFPKRFQQKAEELFSKFESEFWGGMQPAEEEDPDEPAVATSLTVNVIAVLLPPAEHAIWGCAGIMRGIAFRKWSNGKLTKILSNVVPRRSCKVPGTNGLHLGQWYPSRLAALVGGAHGQSVAGIDAGPSGAFSVVISASKKHLDIDDFDTVEYSGGKVDEDTQGKRSLQKSIETGTSVRVLRTSYAGEHAPEAGVRYDGLYKVVSKAPYLHPEEKVEYERFRLERLPDQPPKLACTWRPSKEELDAYGKIDKGYESGGVQYRGSTWI